MLLLILFPFLCSEPPEPRLDSGLLPGRRLLAVRVTVFGGRTCFRHCMRGMRASVEWKLVPHWLAEKPARAQKPREGRTWKTIDTPQAAGQWVVMAGTSGWPTRSLREIMSQQR